MLDDEVCEIWKEGGEVFLTDVEEMREREEFLLGVGGKE